MPNVNRRFSQSGDNPAPRSRQILRELHQAVESLILLVSSRYEEPLNAEERVQLDHLGERVHGLMLASGIGFPALPIIIHPLRPYGPTRVPVYFATCLPPEVGPEALVPSGGVDRQWESAWRSVLIAADARLREPNGDAEPPVGTDDAAMVIAEARALSERRIDEKRRESQHSEKQDQCENAFHSFVWALNRFFADQDPFRPVKPDPRPGLVQLFECLSKLCEVWRLHGWEQNFRRVDREKTFAHYRSNFRDPEITSIAFRYGCALLEKGFAGQLCQEDIDRFWEERVLLGSLGMAEVILNGILGRQVIIFRLEGRLANATPRPGEAESLDAAAQLPGAEHGATGSKGTEVTSPLPPNPDDQEALPAAPATAPAPAGPAADTGDQSRKGKRINERMLSMLQRKPESLYWSARQWADTLDCSTSTIGETPTWKRTIRAAKARMRAERELREGRDRGGADDD
jgi:hypothetical protein